MSGSASGGRATNRELFIVGKVFAARSQRVHESQQTIDRCCLREDFAFDFVRGLGGTGGVRLRRRGDRGRSGFLLNVKRFKRQRERPQAIENESEIARMRELTT